MQRNWTAFYADPVYPRGVFRRENFPMAWLGFIEKLCFIIAMVTKTYAFCIGACSNRKAVQQGFMIRVALSIFSPQPIIPTPKAHPYSCQLPGLSSALTLRSAEICCLEVGGQSHLQLEQPNGRGQSCIERTVVAGHDELLTMSFLRPKKTTAESAGALVTGMACPGTTVHCSHAFGPPAALLGEALVERLSGRTPETAQGGLFGRAI